MLLLALGCLEPFPSDRHDLVDLRIAGMAVEGADLGAARALIWEGTEGWSARAPAQAWSEPEAGLFRLEVTGADGSAELGELEVAEGHAAPRLESWAREVDGAGAHLSLTLSAPATVHWMSPAGTFVEDGAASTRWDAADADGVALADDVWPVVALWFDGEGGNGWATFDVPVGVDGPYLAVGGRLLPVAAGIGSGDVTVLATLVESAGVAGFTLADVREVDGTETAATPCGTTEGAWSPDDLLERRCGRDEVIGARVRLRGEGVP
jgi:hypothetical protein